LIAVVDPVAVKQKAESGAGPDVDETEGFVELLGDPTESRRDDRASAAVVGLDPPNSENGGEFIAMASTSCREQFPGVGVAPPGVYEGQILGPSIKDQGVDRRQERQRQVRVGRSGRDEVEDLAISGDRRADAVIERGVPRTLGLREPRPQRGQRVRLLAHALSVAPRRPD